MKSLRRQGRAIIAVVRRITRFRPWRRSTPLGSVNFGDLKRLTPFSSHFGFDRGTPVDRYYLERFLADNAIHIRGRVLEFGDNRYTAHFGGARVSRSDVFDVDTTNTHASFIGD